MAKLFGCMNQGASVHNHRTADLGASQIEEMWLCYSHFVDRPRADFLRTLGLADDVYLFRDKKGPLLGFQACKTFEVPHEGRPCVVIYTLVADLEKVSRGHLFLQMTVLGRLLLHKLRHPTRRIFWVWTASTYHSYLLMPHYLAEYWPRRDRTEPSHVRKLLDAAIRTVGLKTWDPDSGLLRGGGRLRYRVGAANVSKVSEIPDIAFYAGRNPGHA